MKTNDIRITNMTKFIIALIIITPIALLLAIAKGAEDAKEQHINEQNEE